MIALLSPAKSFHPGAAPVAPALAAIASTKPHFAAAAGKLARAAAALRPAELERLMHISPALARVNAGRFAGFERAESRPAVAAFAGDVYRGLDAPTLSAPALAFAADHLRILSGLYGLLRPFDAVREYRLEMGTAWAPEGSDLYGFWKTRVARRLEAELEAEGSSLVLNLASKEYWRVVEPHLRPKVRVVTVDFRDRGPGGLRFNTFLAKKVRGAMARYLCETEAADPRDLQGFNHAGYRYEGTEGDTMRFVRRA